MSQFKLEIKKSNIENIGDGVFALENIDSHNILGEYKGYIYNDFDKVPDESKPFVYINSYNEIIVPYRRVIMRLMNDIIDLEQSRLHGTRINYAHLKHNCKFIEKNHKVYVKTILPISCGEELYIDYNNSYWKHEYNQPTPCLLAPESK